MKRFIHFAVCAVVAIGTASAFQKQPHPKSQKEVDALNAMFKAPPGDAQIAAAEDLLAKFADTEFKSLALFLEADSYARAKNNFEKAVVYGEQSLAADPTNYQAMLLLARQYASHTGENDLDKEEKLAKATKYANDAIPVITNAPKPNPGVPDDQWANAKKDYIAGPRGARDGGRCSQEVRCSRH